jgi:type IX secretion system PorP/SprF family membrane protein
MKMINSNTTRKLITIIICTFQFYCVNAQDVYFTQWERARTITNPAFIGKDASVYWSSGYRNQWPNLNRNYVTYYSALDINIKPMRAGMAFNYMKDMMRDGSTATENYSLAISRRFQFTKLVKLTLALQATYAKAAVNGSSQSFADYTFDRFRMLSSTLTSFQKQQKTYADFVGGMLLDLNYAHAGFVFSHFTRPNISFDATIKNKLSSKITWHAASKSFALNSKYKLAIGMMGSYQDKADLYIANATLSFRKVMLTGGYNFKNAIFAGAGYKLKHISINYTFDVSTVKSLKMSTSHELNMGVNF